MMKRTINNFKQFVGHVLENKMLHVCGFDGNFILIQKCAGAKMQKLRMTENAKGFFFNLNGKRNYVIQKGDR